MAEPSVNTAVVSEASLAVEVAVQSHKENPTVETAGAEVAAEVVATTTTNK